MSALGHTRRFKPVRAMSAIHSIATDQPPSLDVRQVPRADVTGTLPVQAHPAQRVGSDNGFQLPHTGAERCLAARVQPGFDR
jgi:hypothetical protein